MLREKHEAEMARKKKELKEIKQRKLRQ